MRDVDKTIYNLTFKQEVLAAQLRPHVLPHRIPRERLYLKYNNLLCINCIMH